MRALGWEGGAASQWCCTFQVACPQGTDLAERWGGTGGPRPPGSRGRPCPPRRLSVTGSAPFGRHGDLGRRVAWAGHGSVEPGSGSAFAPPDSRGEHAPGRELLRARRAGAEGSESFLSFIPSLVRSFSRPGNRIGRSVRPWCARGPPELGGGRPRETDT